VLVSITVGAFVVPASADILYVDDDADPNGADGLAWATAFPDLRDALDAARAEPGRFEAIWIVGGVYKPAGPGGDRLARFDMVDGVAVRGGFVGNETTAEERPAFDDPSAPQTIISGDLNGDDIAGDLETNKSDNSEILIAINIGAQSLTLDRLTVERATRTDPDIPVFTVGSALVSGAEHATLTDCSFIENNSLAGSNVVLSSLAGGTRQLERCRFESNRTNWLGGALYIVGIDTAASLIDCEFLDNEAAGGGGALWALCASLNLEDCSFVQNRVAAVSTGSFIENSGGAVYLSQVPASDDDFASLTITGCDFTQNRVMLQGDQIGFAGGGAVRGGNIELLDVDRCTFVENMVINETNRGGSWSIPQAYGGAISCTNFADADFRLEECVFSGNSIAGTGSLFASALSLVGQGAVEVRRCTFEDNRAEPIGSPLPRDVDQQHGTVYLGGAAVLVEDSFWRRNTLVVPAEKASDRSLASGALSIFADDTARISGSVFEETRYITTKPVVTQVTNGLIASAVAIDARTTHVSTSVFLNNSFESGATQPPDGGGLYSQRETGAPFVATRTASIDGTLVTGNTAPLTAGVAGTGTLRIRNSTIAHNHAGVSALTDQFVLDPPSALYADFALEIVNSVIWGNTDASDTDGTNEQIASDGPLTIDHSIIENLDPAFPGVANSDADPLFVDPSSGDFRPAFGSPAIDSGDTTRVPTDLTLDLDGNPRVLDDPASNDTGIPAEPGGPVVDRGAFEFVAGPACPADFAPPFGILDLADISLFIDRFREAGRPSPLPGQPGRGARPALRDRRSRRHHGVRNIVCCWLPLTRFCLGLCSHPLAHRPPHITVDLAFLDRLPFVVLGLARAHAQQDLREPVLEVELERDERHALLIDLPREPLDLALVGEQPTPA
jgi:hypothetical protein